MTTRRTRIIIGWVPALWLGLAVLVPPATAQPQQVDPYGPYPYGSGYYRAFADPYYRDPALPNQGLAPVPPTGRAGSLENFLEDLYGDMGGDESATGPRKRTGPGVPYFSADRRYDKLFNRVYEPNQEVDARAKKAGIDLEKLRTRRDELFQKSQTETDPRKRAELIRELEQTNRQLSQGLTPDRTRGARGTPAARTPARSAVRSPSATAPLTGTIRPPARAPTTGGRPPLGPASGTASDIMTRAMGMPLPAPPAAPGPAGR